FGCAANDLVMSTTIDGTHWTPEQRIPIDPIGGGADHFIPGLAVDLSTISGAAGHLGLAFYYYPQADCVEATCQLDVGFISTEDGGVTWNHKIQLAGPMKTTWLPDTSVKSKDAFMVGDYISTSFSSGDAFPIFAIATAPSGAAECDDPGAVCHEHMYTVVNGLR
ncbi:MAG TPA: exo-alpha-sialidase, partial [Methylomirabilota bacterium]|nr:exo-alpha-sialidase [Methylomirabilota bacterium]